VTWIIKKKIDFLRNIAEHIRWDSFVPLLGVWGRLSLRCRSRDKGKNHDIQGVKVQHLGNVMDEVIEAAYTVVNQAERTLPLIEDMRGVELSSAEQTAFGTAAAALRFEEDAQVRPDQVLRPHRSADLGNDLWRVFNRAQENIIRGGILTRSVNISGRESLRRSRQVRGIDEDVRLNRALWTLAEEMRKIKTA
jgi:hypothetical protein